MLEKSFYISALTIKRQCCVQTFLIFFPGILLWLLLLRLLALQLFLLGKRCCYSCRLIVTATADLMPFSLYLCRFKKKLSLCLPFASLELITFAHQYLFFFFLMELKHSNSLLIFRCSQLNITVMVMFRFVTHT